MVMETNLDMNQHKMLNEPKPRFLISGLYIKPKKNEKKLVLFHEQKAAFTLLPVNAKLKKVVCTFCIIPGRLVTLKHQIRVLLRQSAVLHLVFRTMTLT